MGSSSFKILIIEDNLNDVQLFKKILYESVDIDYEITHTEKLEGALELLNKKEFDLILLDLFLPDSCGIETFKKVYESAPHIPIMILATVKDNDLITTILQKGNKNYLIKEQINKDLLTNTIRHAMMRRKGASLYITDDKGKKISSEQTIELNEFICKSKLMQEVYKLIKRYSEVDGSLLILGESGSGKDRAAETIHILSKRKDKPFIKINCASIPENLLESELFGYKKGAFTGAIADYAGKFESANGGTIFLNEIGEISLAMQAKLLQVVEEKTFYKLGDSKTYTTDVRIIAATNKDLTRLVSEGKFREDLYYRLKILTLVMPSLRERIEDIPLLVEHFIDVYSKKYGRNITGIDKQAMDILLAYRWYGNVRELKSAVEYACVISTGKMITVEDLPPDIVKSVEEKETSHLLVSDFPDEKSRILEALKKSNHSKTKAARLLGISRTTLWHKMKLYGLVERK